MPQIHRTNRKETHRQFIEGVAQHDWRASIGAMTALHLHSPSVLNCANSFAVNFARLGQKFGNLSARALIFSFALSAIFFTASAAQAQWRVISSAVIPAASDRIVHVQKRIGKDGITVRLDLVLFDAKSTSLRVIDNPGGQSTLGEAMQKTHALAGVNGGYFHADYTPLGLLVADGVRIHSFEKAKLLSGLMIVSRNRPALLRVGEFKTSKDITQAVQSGPFLVDRGVAVPGLNNARAAARTILLSDRIGEFALALCRSTTLAEAAQILAEPAMVTEMKVMRALNLDGGSSSALWVSGGGDSFYIPETKPVRNFLALVPG